MADEESGFAPETAPGLGGPSLDRLAGMAGLGTGGDDGVTTPWDMPEPDARAVLAGLPEQWGAEADRIVAGPARVAGDEHGAYCRERARTLRACASELAAVLATQPPAPDDMFERAYMEVQEILDEALGTEEEDGAGAGMAADVALLADRLKAAEAEVMRLKGGTPLPGMPGAVL